MAPVTVNIIASIFCVIILTVAFIATIRMVRRRRDEHSLSNHSATVSLDNDKPVFDMSSSGFEDEEAEISAVDEPETVAEPTNDDETAPLDVETTAAGLLQEFLADKPENADEEIIPEIEANADTEAEAVNVIDFAEKDEPANHEIEEEEEGEPLFDPGQPAYAARASVAIPAVPLFKVAPPSVTDEEVQDEPLAATEVSDKIEPPVVEEKEVEEKEVEEKEAAPEPAEPVHQFEAKTDYSFEDVPVPEIIEEDDVLGEAITLKISQLDADLNTIETLVSEIEQSLADFEPLSGFELDEEVAA